MTKRFGFTLAEVLITLGIIGVVAAMTIPTLISNTNGAQFKTAYKKALSTLNQAVLMNIAMEDTDFSSLVEDNPLGEAANGATEMSMSWILKERMQSATNITDSYFKVEGENSTPSYPKITYYAEHTCTANDANCKTGESTFAQEGTKVTIDQEVTVDGNWAVYSFADGTAFAYNGNAENCGGRSLTCVGFIDVNGATPPNTQTVCDDGTENGGTDTKACTVDNANIHDIYPVFFYDQTVEPATDAARAVLFGK